MSDETTREAVAMVVRESVNEALAAAGVPVRCDLGAPITLAKADEILRLIALARTSVPEGWVMVPKEPTEEMIAAAVESLRLPWREIQRMLGAYQAMLSSLPGGML